MPRPPAPEPRIVEPLCAVFRRKLRAEGLKYTPERARVLDAIIRTEGVFDAEQIRASLRTTGTRVSKATVYRTLRLLQEAGIVQRVLFGEDEPRYLLAYGHAPHDLLIRVDTRAVETVDAPELIALRDRLCRERGLEARGHRFQVFAAAPALRPGNRPSRV